MRINVLAALTITALLIPSGLAYGELAGLTPVAGLYTGMLGMIGYALFATSRVQIVGPESQMAILVAAALGPLVSANKDPAHYAAMAAALALICAGICLLAGLARLGFLADYLSQSVLVGYITGVAFVIISSQIGKLLGYSAKGDTLVETVGAVIKGLGQTSWTSAAVGAASLGLVLLLKRLVPKWPNSLIVVALMTAASAIFDFKSHGVAVVGQVPAGIPAPSLPDVSFSDLVSLIGPALGIVLVVFADTVLTARAYAARSGGYRIDANAELIGLAAGNLGSGLFSGFPIGASDSRTAVNYASRGSGQVVSLFAAAFTAVFLLLLTPLIATLPSPTLAGVVIVAASSLIRVKDFVGLARFRRFELILAIVTFLGVSIIGILPGILIAVAVNLLDVIYRLSKPIESVLGPEEGSTRWRAMSPREAAKAEPQILAVRFGGPLIFANAEYVRVRTTKHIQERGVDLKWLIIDCEAVTLIDSNGVQSLAQLWQTCQEREITVALARVTSPLRHYLRRTEVWHKIGKRHRYDRVADAVQAARNAIAKSGGASGQSAGALDPAEHDQD